MLKEQATADERYEDAQRLKSQVESLYPLGAEIEALEAKKRRATLEEDYQLAHILKTDIEELRAQVASYRVNLREHRMQLSLPSNHHAGLAFASPVGPQPPRRDGSNDVSDWRSVTSQREHRR